MYKLWPKLNKRKKVEITNFSMWAYVLYRFFLKPFAIRTQTTIFILQPKIIHKLVNETPTQTSIKQISIFQYFTLLF